jgi:hypothetical protein
MGWAPSTVVPSHLLGRDSGSWQYVRPDPVDPNLCPLEQELFRLLCTYALPALELLLGEHPPVAVIEKSGPALIWLKNMWSVMRRRHSWLPVMPIPRA